jgi:hypothetical protein
MITLLRHTTRQVHIEAAFGTLRKQAGVSDELQWSDLEHIKKLGKGEAA